MVTFLKKMSKQEKARESHFKKCQSKRKQESQIKKNLIEKKY